MTATVIAGTGSYVPERVLTNADLERMVDTSDEWITARTGIRERRIAADNQATSDLAIEAGRRAIEAAGITAQDVDLVLVATATPDMFFPATACLVQTALGATNAAAFDLSAACSGFIYGLNVADAYIRSGSYKNVLLIGAETMSRVVDWEDRTTCVLFGDGAGAVLLQAGEGDTGSGAPGLMRTDIHSDGAAWDYICVPGGGSRMPPSDALVDSRQQFLKMKGNETFKVAVRNMERAARTVLEDAGGIKAHDLALVVPHQANMRILNAVAERLELPAGKVYVNLDRYGNTSAASVPLAFDEAVRAGRLERGDLVLMLAFGSGLTWGAALLRWG
ncbi:MAG: ketoacyl-ACP synthase III [Nitrospirota bacterium]|nr:ketoacyl-ACP synthase III [Nitrospirota bacterium]